MTYYHYRHHPIQGHRQTKKVKIYKWQTFHGYVRTHHIISHQHTRMHAFAHIHIFKGRLKERTHKQTKINSIITHLLQKQWSNKLYPNALYHLCMKNVFSLSSNYLLVDLLNLSLSLSICATLLTEKCQNVAYILLEMKLYGARFRL